MRLKEVLGGIAPEDFFKEILLPRKLLFIKSAITAKNLPSLEMMEKFIKNPENSKSIRLTKKGRHSSISEIKKLEDFYNQIKDLSGNLLWDTISNKDSSIHLTGFFHEFPGIKELSFDLFKYTPFGCQSYAVISRGLEESPYSHHEDPMDLFAIQVAGKKRWKLAVDSNGKTFFNLKTNLPYDPKDPSQKYLEYTMSPGDVLFLPYQTPHYVEQVGDEVSIHFVIGITRNFKGQGLSFLREKLNQLTLTDVPYELRDASELYLEDFKQFKIQLEEFSKNFDPQSEYENFLKLVKSYDVVRTKRG